MCGRYFLNSAPKGIRADWFPDDFSETRINPLLGLERYNIAPSQLAPVIRRIEGELIVSDMRWGFCPQWMKDASRYQVNARAETIFEKPMFRAAARATRCLVPASGWYEWQAVSDGKQPYAFHFPDYALFTFAGLWTTGRDKDGKLEENFLILTTEASPFAAQYHHRMPVILDGKGGEAWLDRGNKSADALMPLLRPFENDTLTAHPVSRRVNSPKNDDAGCLEALTA